MPRPESERGADGSPPITTPADESDEGTEKAASMPGVVEAELITTIESSLPDAAGAAGGSLTGSVTSAGGSAGAAGGSLTGSAPLRAVPRVAGLLPGPVLCGRFRAAGARSRGRRGGLAATGSSNLCGRFRGCRGGLAHGVRNLCGRFRGRHGRRGSIAHRLGTHLGTRNTRGCQADEGNRERHAEVRRLRGTRHRPHSPFARAPSSLGRGETPIGLATRDTHPGHDWKGQTTAIPKQVQPTRASQISPRCAGLAKQQ